MSPKRPQANQPSSLEEQIEAHVYDPRRDQGQEYPLKTIIILAVIATIGNANDWIAVERFCQIKADWLRELIPGLTKIPSHDTFRRVFILIDPDAWQACFKAWITGLAEMTLGEVIAVDGKTLRGSHNRRDGRDTLKMVSAWATQAGLVIAQKDVPEDTNEIAAVPELLKSLVLKGCIVTMDAANCQTGNTQIIVDRGGEYVLALKENQSTLYAEALQTWAEIAQTGVHKVKHETLTTRHQAHGRKETRIYTLITDFEHIDFLNRSGRWHKLGAIGVVERRRKTADKETSELSFYISSLTAGVDRFADAVRRHWKIENSLHWVLDVAFREDQHRARIGFQPENFAVLRHFAINLIKLESTSKDNPTGRRQRAGWDNAYMLAVLQAGAVFKDSGA